MFQVVSIRSGRSVGCAFRDKKGIGESVKPKSESPV